MKSKKVLIPVFAIFSILIIFAALFLSGAFKGQNNEIPVYSDTNASELSASQTVNSVFDKLPDNLSGVFLNIENDIQAGDTSNAFISEIVYDYDYYRNISADTVFIKPDCSGKFSFLKNADGTQFDTLACALAYAELNNYYKVLVIDDSVSVINGKISFENVKNYLSTYRFDAVLYKTSLFEHTSDFLKAVKYYSENIRDRYPDVAVGCEFTSDLDKKYIDDYSLEVLKKSYIDFCLIDASFSTADTVAPFESVFGWWNLFASYFKQTKFYCEHRCDLINSSGAGWDNYREISIQYKKLAEFENFYGSAYYSTASLKKEKSSVQKLSALIFDGFADNFTVDTMTVNSIGSSVNFTGSVTDGTSLFNGHNKLESNAGRFSVNIPLVSGSNKICLKNCGSTHDFQIYSNSPLTLSVAPTGNMNMSRDEILQPYAVCKDGTSVTAYLSGKSFVLQPVEVSDATLIPDGYKMYSCNIDLSQFSFFRFDLGELKISFLLNGEQQIANCGNITLLSGKEGSLTDKIADFIYNKFYSNKIENSEKLFDNSPDGTVDMFSDNGLGTALMCRIINDHTEQLSTVDDYDTYHPDYSTLMEGTIDYVNGISLSEEGWLRYELNCGMSVYAENCELIQNAYVLPQNNLSVFSVSTSEAFTDIKLSSDWLVPVNLSVQQQTYKKGYFDYSFNIDSFSATYVDVDFYHTAAINGIEQLVFSAPSVFSSAEALKKGKDIITLRFYLSQQNRFYGFDISHDENGNIILSFKNRSAAGIAGKTVMLDPGHGGLYMTGTALTDNSITESSITLSVALKTKAILESYGAEVIMTRSTDAAYTLYERAQMNLVKKPDVFVSIHCDGTSSEFTSGTHTFYYTPFSQPLAASIHNALVGNYRNYIYTPDSPNYANIDRKIKYYPFYVTRFYNCPSVLVETGFMSNVTEGKLLTDANVQSWIADGIVKGLANYFAQ